MCSLCEERGLTCEWDLPTAQKIEDLVRRLEEAERSLQEAHVLIEALQLGSNQKSTMLLAKLRMGISFSDLAESIRTGTVDQDNFSLLINGSR